MKISGTSLFLKKTLLFYQPVPFYGKNLSSPFSCKFRKVKLLPLYKGGAGSNMKEGNIVRGYNLTRKYIYLKGSAVVSGDTRNLRVFLHIVYLL